MLASALCVAAATPGLAQQAAAPADSAPTQNTVNTAAMSNPPKEGFWGRVNPFARKKWVHRQLDPITGQLVELNEVNAKNSRDIKDVDARAQAGINKAQSAADQANQTASAAGQQATQAGAVAGQANGKVGQLTTTVDGLDQYSQVKALSIGFRAGQPVLSADARQQLDDLATSITTHQGYLLEMEAYAPGSGSVGIQNSAKLADVVKRYLVTEHNIPVYRLHAVALGNAHPAGSGDEKPTHASHVELRLMENTLAARDASSPRLDASRTGAERP